MVFLPNLGDNRRDRLCFVSRTASTQSSDFLDLGQKSSFLGWKRHQVPIFKKTIIGFILISNTAFRNFQLKNRKDLEFA